MNINIKKSFLYHFILLFVISGCSFNVIDYSNIKDKNFGLSFSSDIPNELQTKIRTVFLRSDSAENKYSDFIKISEFTIETYDIFSGKALRALEVEVKSSVLLSISTSNLAALNSVLSNNVTAIGVPVLELATSVSL